MAKYMVEFDRQKLDRLKQRYNEAVKNGEELFVFEGGEYVIGYAKHVIEYLEQRLSG